MRLSKEERKALSKAFRDMELIAQGLKPDPAPNMLQTIALLMVGYHRELARVRQDQDYVLQGLRAVLKSLADDHKEVRDFLDGNRGDTPRYEDL
jgi:hypothetical protein